MECKNCKIKMKKVNMSAPVYTQDLFIWYKKKGTSGSKKVSTVSCYACVECGDIKLLADEPEKFKNI